MVESCLPLISVNLRFRRIKLISAVASYLLRGIEFEKACGSSFFALKAYFNKSSIEGKGTVGGVMTDCPNFYLICSVI